MISSNVSTIDNNYDKLKNWII